MASKQSLIAISLFLLTVVLLIGCQPDSQGPEVTPETTSGEPVLPPEGTELPSSALPQVSEYVAELLGLADKRVKSLDYYYHGPPNPSEGFHYTVHGDTIMIALPEQNIIYLEGYFDTVFLNAAAQTAVGYCKENSQTRCPDNEKTFDVEYDDYYYRTPQQWLELLKSPTQIGSGIVQSRNTVILEEVVEGIPTRLWVDTYYGLPLKIEQTIGGKVTVISFDNLVVNKVSEADVLP